MNISVFGLGYVGTVTAACLAKLGHNVLGVDIASRKVDQINHGQSPIIEKDIDELVREMVTDGRLRATTELGTAVSQSDIAIICVGTPSLPDGSVDTSYVVRLMSEIGTALVGRQNPYHIVLRSTVVPGTTLGVVAPLLEAACKQTLGKCIELSFHPEFLREGTSVEDFFNPSKIVVGERIPGSGGPVIDTYRNSIQAKTIRCPIPVAETVKYCNNIFHALKITFANEIGQFCASQGIDSNRILEIFCLDSKLNISPAYLRPGFAFGGSCLPKDLRAFLAKARQKNLHLPMLESILASNSTQLQRAKDSILASGMRRIGMFGIAFKPGTDDLRESPLVDLAKWLLGEGTISVIYDEKVNIARLIGGNQSYVQLKIPQLSELITDDVTHLDSCDLIVVGHPATDELVENWLARGKTVVDLTGARSGQVRPGLCSLV